MSFYDPKKELRKSIANAFEFFSFAIVPLYVVFLPIAALIVAPAESVATATIIFLLGWGYFKYLLPWVIKKVGKEHFIVTNCIIFYAKKAKAYLLKP